jgi:hypothetical protein
MQNQSLKNLFVKVKKCKLKNRTRPSRKNERNSFRSAKNPSQYKPTKSPLKTKPLPLCGAKKRGEKQTRQRRTSQKINAESVEIKSV